MDVFNVLVKAATVAPSSAAAKGLLNQLIRRFGNLPPAQRTRAVNTALTRIKERQPTVYRMIREPVEEILAKHHGIPNPAAIQGKTPAATLTGVTTAPGASAIFSSSTAVKGVKRVKPTRSVLSGAKKPPARTHHIGQLPTAPAAGSKGAA
jgi:hypothetical protein